MVDVMVVFVGTVALVEKLFEDVEVFVFQKNIRLLVHLVSITIGQLICFNRAKAIDRVNCGEHILQATSLGSNKLVEINTAVTGSSFTRVAR